MIDSRQSSRVAFGLAAILGCCLVAAAEPVPQTDPGAGEPSTQVEPAAPLTLYDASALALMQNPELQDSSWRVRVGEAREEQARKIPNPEVDVRMWRLGGEGARSIQDINRWRVIVSEEFELGGKRRRRINQASAARDVADWDLAAKRDEIAAEVTTRFVEVLGAQRRVEVWRQYREFHDGMQRTVATLVESGSMRPVELHQLRRRSGLARIELQRAEAELAVSRFQLTSSWGNSSPRFTEAIGDMERVPSVPEMDTVLELAQSGPAIARWQSELARRQAAIALAKSTAVPDLRMGVGARWSEDVDLTDYLIDLEIELPIFDRKQGDIREARYRLERAKVGQKAALAAGGEGIAEFHFALSESEARRSALVEDVLPAVRAAFEAFRRAFEAEAKDLDDLLDARADLAQAEVDYIDSLVDFHQTLAALENIVGQPLGDIN